MKYLCFLTILMATSWVWSNSCNPKPIECSVNELPNTKTAGLDPELNLDIAGAIDECQEIKSASCMPIEDFVGNEQFDFNAQNVLDALVVSDLDVRGIDTFKCDHKGKQKLYGEKEALSLNSQEILQYCLTKKDLERPDFEDKKDGKPFISRCEPLYKDLKDQISKTGSFKISCTLGSKTNEWEMKLPPDSFFESLKEMIGMNSDSDMDAKTKKMISDKIDLFKKQLSEGDNLAVANFIQIQRSRKMIENKYKEYDTRLPHLPPAEREQRKKTAIKLSLLESTLTQIDAAYDDGANVKQSPSSLYKDSRIVGICPSSSQYLFDEKSFGSNLRSDYAHLSNSIPVLNKEYKTANHTKIDPGVQEREELFSQKLEKKVEPLRELDRQEDVNFGTIHHYKPLFEEFHTRKVDSSYKKICPDPVLYESPRQKDLFEDNHYAFAENNPELLKSFEAELEKFAKTLKQKNTKGEPAVNMKKMILTSSASTFTNTPKKYDDSLCQTMSRNMSLEIQEHNQGLYQDTKTAHSKYCDGDKLNAKYAERSSKEGFALSYLELSMMRSLALKEKVQDYFSKAEGLDPKFKDPAYIDAIVATNYRGSNFIECPSDPTNHPLYNQLSYGKPLKTCEQLAAYNGTSGPLSPFALGDKNVTKEEREQYKEYKYVKLSMDAEVNPAPDISVDKINYEGEAMSMTANYCAYGDVGGKPLKPSGGGGSKNNTRSYTPKRNTRIKPIPCPEW